MGPGSVEIIIGVLAVGPAVVEIIIVVLAVDPVPVEASGIIVSANSRKKRSLRPMASNGKVS